MMKQERSSSIRNAVLKVTLISNAAILLAALFVASFFGESVFSEIDQRALLERAHDIEALLNENGAADYLGFKLKEDWGNRGLQKVFGLVLDENGNEYLATPKFPDRVKKQLLENKSKTDLLSFHEQGMLYRSVIVPSIIAGKRFLIAVSIDRSQEMDFIKKLKSFALYVALGVFILSFLVTQFLLKSILNPIEKLRKEVLKLKSVPNGFRINLQGLPSEISPFVTQTNELLQLLEVSIEKNRSFSSEIAHEIRTPVHRARMALELGLKSSEDVSELKEVILDAYSQLEHLSGLVGDMLFLSRVERGLEQLNLEAIQVGFELRELIDYYQVVAEEKKQRIILNYSDEVVLRVRPELFKRAVGNLIENSIRYSLNDTEIKVTFSKVDHELFLVIEDQGEGFSHSALEHFPDRVYRDDGSRIFKKEGLGLGLSLVKAVMDLHGGRVEFVQSPAKGSTLRLVFPLTSV